MRVNADSSALINWSVGEAESDAMEAVLDRYVADDTAIVSSSPAWIEVSRALRTRLNDGHNREREIQDAIHLATAVLLDADVVLTYDARLIEACDITDSPSARLASEPIDRRARRAANERATLVGLPDAIRSSLIS